MDYMRRKMTLENTLTNVATNVDVTEVGGQTVVDFDIEANTDYEIQSAATVEDGDVVSAAVRFGRVPTYDEVNVDSQLLSWAWASMVGDETDLPQGHYEADMSDFEHDVPHLRVEDVDAETFADAIETLAELVEDILRGGARVIDNQIDDYL